MEWVETPEKGRNASALLRKSEECFARLSTLDKIVLDTSRVLLIVKSVDVRDRDKVGLLLHTDHGLTTDSATVKGVCSRFNKQREWGNEKSSATGPTPARKFDEPSPTRKEEARDWLEIGPTLTGAVKGPSGGAALEELTQMVCDLQIAQA